MLGTQVVSAQRRFVRDAEEQFVGLAGRQDRREQEEEGEVERSRVSVGHRTSVGQPAVAGAALSHQPPPATADRSSWRQTSKSQKVPSCFDLCTFSPEPR